MEESDPTQADGSRPPLALLAELRQRTSAQHVQIEALLRLAEPMVLTRYGIVIGGFHAFLAPWEIRIRTALPERLHGWFDARRRAPLASQDLLFLDAGPTPRIAAAAQAAVASLQIGTLDQAIGSMYVIEGSALGGQTLAPHLRRTLGLEPGRGASYFHGFGEQTAAMWRAFRLLAEAEIGSDPASRRNTVGSAQQTFEALNHTFRSLDR